VAKSHLQSKPRTLIDRLITELELMVIVSLGYAGAMAIVKYGVKLIQDGLYDHPLLAFTSLIFLPHGIRILAAFLVGARSIMPLTIGALLSNFLGLDNGI